MMKRALHSLLAVAVLAGLVGVPLHARAEDLPVVTGFHVLTEDAVRKAIGPMPSDGRRGPWVTAAAKRVVRLYRRQGYTYARVWHSIDPDGTVTIDVDEGRMAGIVFRGASATEAVFYRVEFVLPGEVFHRRTVDENVARLWKAHKKSLTDVYYEVVDRSEQMKNELGDAVAARELQIHLVHKLRDGWTLDASLDSTYGLVPGFRYWNNDMFLDDDFFHIKIDVAVPYRRLISEPDPKFTWVHGLVGLKYRFPHLTKARLVPGFDVGGEVSYLSRTDVGLASLRAGRWAAMASLEINLWRPILKLTVGVGATNTYIFDVTKMPDDPEQPPRVTPGERNLQRYLAHAEIKLDLDPEEVIRTARKRWLKLEATLALSQQPRVMFDSRMSFQNLFHWGNHDLFLRARGLYLAGDVKFWDHKPLSSNCMRTFFSDRYWVRETLQAEIAFRGAVWRDKVKLGVFYDMAAFGDATRNGRPFAMAYAGGPSMHFLILDQISLDLYYSFGYAPVGFNHNFSLNLQSVF